MEWFAEYGLFLAKGVTGVILLALLLRLIARSRQEGEGLQAGYLDVEALNDRYQAEVMRLAPSPKADPRKAGPDKQGKGAESE